MKKRILSIVLAVLMLVSVLPTAAFAADVTAPTDGSSVTAQDGNVTVTKKAEWTDVGNGKAKITFELTGKTSTSTEIAQTDIVLVIDCSGSMKNGRMDQAKTAANNFVQKFLGKDASQSYKDNVQIAVVPYSTTVERGGCDLTNSVGTLNSAIEGLSAGGGTNIQHGIYVAQEKLEKSSRKDANKIMVVLTDGDPTFSFKGTSAVSIANDENTYGVDKTKFPFIVSGFDYSLHDGGWFNDDYYDYIGCGNDYVLHGTGFMGSCNGEDASYSLNNRQYTVKNNGVGTVSAAYAAKAVGTTIYGIGVGDLSSDATNTMNSVVTGADYYFTATQGSDAIEKAFSSIATSVTKAMAKDAQITDPLGSGFTRAVGGNNEYISENLGELTEEKKTIWFTIQYDTENPTGADKLPTNNGAELTYKDAQGKPQKLKIDDPELPNPAKKVSYEDGYTTDNSGLPATGYGDAYYWPGKTANAESGFTRTGYDFTGWKVKETGADQVAGADFTVNNNTTLVAQWAKNAGEQTVTVKKVWDGKAADNVTIDVMNGNEVVNTVTLPDNGNWEKELTLAQYDYAADGTASEITYHAVETAINGKTFENNQVADVRDDGVTIGSWSVDGIADTTVTNKYEDATKYTVTYAFANEGPQGVDVPEPVTGYEGQEISLETVTAPAGWTFDGWYTDQKCETKANDPYTVPQGGQTLYGKWTQENLDVTTTKTATRTRGGDTTDLPDGGSVRVGDTITYTVTFKNTGNTALGKYDVLYGVEQFFGKGKMKWVTNGDQPVDGQGVGRAVTFEIAGIGGLAPGASTQAQQFTYVVNEDDETEGTVKNKACARTKVLNAAGTYDTKFFTIVTHEVKVEQRHTVQYRYDTTGLSEDVVKDLPTLPPDSSKLYYEGDKVTVAATPGEQTIDGYKYTFDGWYVGETKYAADSEYTMEDTNVTFVGKWTQEEIPPTTAPYIIEYYKMDADGNYPDVATDIDASSSNVATIGESHHVDPNPGYGSNYELDTGKDNVDTLPEIDKDATKNVFKFYYKALGKMNVLKTATAPREEDGTVKVGTEITYRILVQNTGARNLTGVSVTDTFDGAGDLVFEEQEGVTVTQTEEGWEIELGGLPVGEEKTIVATYTVLENDVGYTITNTVVGEAEELDGSVDDDVTVDTESKNQYVITVPVYKTVKNETNKDFDGEKFNFEIFYEDAEGKTVTEKLSIEVGAVAKKDEDYEYGEITLHMSQEDFDQLPTGKVGKGDDKVRLPYIYIRELEGETKRMSYDTRKVKLYLYEDEASAWSVREPIYDTVRMIALADPIAEDASEAAAHFVNIYGKVKDEDPIKVGPQLNRNDHVAYIMGYPDGTVHPEGQITRAEACTIFFRLLTDSSRDYYFSKTNDYTDVARTDWYNNAISTLSNAGIVTGYDDGTFRPNQPITRGEMAKIIAGFANLNKGSKTFSDLAGHWSKTYVELAAGNGWIAGYPDGTFRPDQKITRAETVTMINRVLERVPAKESRLLSRSIMLTFPDNQPGEWYYIAIQEASNSHEYQRSVYEAEGDEMWTKLIDNVDWTKLER